ncbi:MULTISPECIES: tape measure protein [Pantoea]|uniref:tape measure protein n=1 Tax=Pantoea TaxID=53335 RepID=UPI00257B6D5F|nr:MULTISPECIES: tape measure protein [Pantoea]
MASEQQVGNIVYEVEMNVAKLLENQKQVNDRLDKLQGSFDSTSKSVSGAEKSFSSLSKVASALTAALSIQQVANYADAWTTLNNKLANSIRTGESLAEVTQRVFDITQSTRSSLDATASLYARLERATREYGTSAENLAKLTTIINQGFVVSGATAQEAENAIIQLSQGLASGALRGEEFNSVNEQGNRLIVALADSMGVSIGQMRAMAAQGKLTTDVVVNGLLGQGDAIGREFANTTQTIGQAFQIASNNITQFVGSSATVKAGVAIFNNAVITLSQNLDVVSTVILSVTAIMGSRYVGALAAATAAQIANAAAAYRAAAAQGAMGVAATAARGALALVGGPAGAAALAASAIFYFYQKAQQAKQEANDLADGVSGLVSKFRDMSATEVGASIARLRETLPSLTDSVEDAEKAFNNAMFRVRDLRKEIDNWGVNTTRGRQASEALSGAMDQQNIAAETLEKAQRRLSQTQSAITLGQAQLTTGLKTGIDLLSRESKAAGDAAGMMSHFAQSVNLAATAKEKFNSSSLQIPRSADADKYNQQLEDENKLLAINDKRLRAVTQARMDASSKGGNANQINTAGELAAAQYDLQQAESNRTKATKETAKAETQAEQAEKRRQKSLQELTDQVDVAELEYKGLNREAAQLAAIQDLGAGATSTQIQQAAQQAGQIFDVQQKAADKKAALEHDAFANAARQRDQDLAQVQRQLAAGDISFEQSQKRRAEIASTYSEVIAQANAKSAVTPQQTAAGTVDPVQALANENAQKLALIKQYENQKLITEQQSLALRNSLNTQYDQQRTAAMWQMWRNQSVGNEAVAASFDSIAGNASNAFTGMVTGSMSAQEAMSSLASNTLNSLVNTFVQMGIEWVKSSVMGAAAQQTAIATTTAASVAGTATTTAASTAAAGTTMAAWLPAALVASIGSFGAAAVVGGGALLAAFGLIAGLSGKRKNGGPVSAGSMYQVGEGGMPEIYQASSGKQYMIPGDNGSVISNKDMMSSAGGSGGVVINIQNYTSATVDAQANNTGGGLTIDVIVADLNQGGPIRQAITRNTTASARATE